MQLFAPFKYLNVEILVEYKGYVELDERLTKVREETKAMFEVVFKHDLKR